MYKALENIDILAAEPDDTTVGAFMRAWVEGHYAMALLDGVTPDQERVIGGLIAKEIADPDTTIYDPEAEEPMQNPFIVPDEAIYALRLALRVLVNKGGLQHERDAAIRAIGSALATIEPPE